MSLVYFKIGATVNSLRQVIRRNKADMADDAVKSLDLMRRVSTKEGIERVDVYYLIPAVHQSYLQLIFDVLGH
ncbi:hypothetical protein DICVIV_02452 [Dictyocaulus viviparus]|uniref:Uncharacterized protein n=1 Tax=Dictyocaulus viviparus TaxID=29172 RepID=A0A0D8Y9U4_DICVI|nr:hypothetical protein DICVIV_02452 [Dictyocaulus viviparus]